MFPSASVSIAQVNAAISLARSPARTESKITRIDHGEFTLEWFEAPEYPPFKSRPQDIAVPHPEFRVSGK